MDWITNVPISLPGFPNLSWAILTWLALFVYSVVFVGRITWRSWRAYRATRIELLAEADRLLALGALIGHSLVLSVCLLGMAIGVLAGHGPRARGPLTVEAGLFTLLFLGMATGLTAKSVILDYYHRAALRALRFERAQKKLPLKQGVP